MSTRVVLTDVTVTDSQGNPVRGLPRSDFHIFDDNHPQPIASFEEHTQPLTPAVLSTPTSPNIASNDFLLHPPSPVNIILIDPTTLNLTDQMYVYEELTRFVRSLPPDEPVAIFTRSGQVTLPLQNFTSDHPLLLAAIRRAVPQFRPPAAQYTNDFDTLQEMANYLSQIPGRKNLLWFSGGSNQYLQTAVADMTFFANAPSRRPLYDLLESERIALYPIDARGLTVEFSKKVAFQHLQINDDAEATGGKAHANNNGLAGIASNILATDSNSYTLSYSPQGLSRDGKWHQVKITLDNPHYQLSYRSGYFDDGQNNLPAPGKTRTLLRADGQSMQIPTDHGEPIIFQARILPASEAPASLTPEFGSKPLSPRKGQTVYSIRYILPAATIQPRTIDGNIATDNLRSVVIAFNHLGTAIASLPQSITVNVDQSKVQSDPNAFVTFDRQIRLPSGEDYLYLAVWDATTGRFGTINLSLDVKNTPRTKP